MMSYRMAATVIAVLGLFAFPFGTNAQQSVFGGCNVTFETGNNVVLCSSVSIFVLPSGSPVGGTYSGTGVLDDFFFPSIAGPGQHIISYSYDDGICVGIATDTITVVAAIPIALAGDFDICEGESTTITALNGEDWEWDTGNTTMSETFSPIESTPYSVYGFDVNGCLAATGFTIVVYELPQITFSGDTSLCIGESTNILASGGTSYLWDDGTPTAEIVIAPTAESLLHVVVTNDDGCVSDASITVYVHEYPILELSGEGEICNGETTIITASGADNYLWSDATASESITVSPMLDQTFSVIGTNQYLCSTEGFFEVLVHELPLVEISGIPFVCEGSSASLTASGADFYYWGEDSASPQIEVSPIENTTYFVIGTDEFGCYNTAEFSLIFQPYPVIEVLVDFDGCMGDSIVWNVSGAQDYFWNDEVGLNTFTLIAFQEVTSVTFSAIDALGCQTPDVLLTQNVLSLPEILISGPEGICLGESAILEATGGASYEWSNLEIATQNVVEPLETSSFSVVGTDEFGCSNVAYYEIVVYDLPIVGIDGSTLICFGDETLLTAIGAQNYLWNNGLESESIVISPDADTTYTVMGVDAFGCLGQGIIDVTVAPLPFIEITGTTEYCFGEMVVLFAAGAVNYIWSNGDVTSEMNDMPWASMEYQVSGTDDNGCVGEQSSYVLIYDLPEITFTMTADSVCDLSSAIELIALPDGGIFSGDGVSSDLFQPSVDLWGWNEITYLYTDDNGCSQTSMLNLFVDNCSSVIEMISNQLSIYPNPFTDEFRIQSATLAIEEVNVMDATGRMVTSYSLQGATYQKRVDTTSLLNGFYTISIRLSDGSWTSLQAIKK